MQSSPLGLALLLLAPISWAIGSVWGTRLSMPRPLTAAAAQLFVAGWVLLAVGLVRGERIEATPSAISLLALAYLIVFGSVVALPLILGGVVLVTLAQRRITPDHDEPTTDPESQAIAAPLADLADDAV